MAEAHRIPTRKDFKDITGRRFERLLVVSYQGKPRANTSAWLCQCDCGKTTIVPGRDLRSGHTKSCGCLHLEALLARAVKHGHSRVGKKTQEYNSWRGMKNRCSDPAFIHYDRYGGRGIKVCERWLTFENFLADMGPKPTPKHSIERKDNDKDYEPGNCVWATGMEQSENKSNTKIVEFDGKKMSVSKWERLLGFSRSVVQGRLRAGWSVEDSLTTPQTPR